jgi:hypothetical protein
LIAPKVTYTKIAELSTAVDQLGCAENARDGKVFAPREGKLQFPFWGKPNQDKPTVLKTPALYTPAVIVRVG